MRTGGRGGGATRARAPVRTPEAAPPGTRPGPPRGLLCFGFAYVGFFLFVCFLLLTLRNIGLPERKNTAFGLNSYWEPQRFSSVITVKTETTEYHAVSLPGPRAARLDFSVSLLWWVRGLENTCTGIKSSERTRRSGARSGNGVERGLKLLNVRLYLTGCTPVTSSPRSHRPVT